MNVGNESEFNQPTDTGIDQVLAKLKSEVKSEINCMTVGKIKSFDSLNQTAQVEIPLQRVVKAGAFDANGLPLDRYIPYPVLVKCPVVFMNGGGAYISFPIQPGDDCIVLFCDRDIDTWWEGGKNMPPNSDRVHDMSDGVVLVGIRNKTNPITYDADKLKIYFGGGKITIDSEGNIVIDAPLLKTVNINPII